MVCRLDEATLAAAPWGYDTHTIVETHTSVTPKRPPYRLRWTIGPVRPKNPHQHFLSAGTSPFIESEITVQLTADQQVDLNVRAEDAYDNPVDISGADITWTSSDEGIITVTADDSNTSKATAVAVGPTGTASVTVAGGQYQGSLAIDVVAGDITEIVIEASEPTDKA